jgi:mycothiol synthase
MSAPAAIRPGRVEDADGIRAVMEASLVVDAFPGFTRGDIDRSIARLPGDPAGVVVAELDDGIVGYAWPRHDDLTVHPDHRRHGHGRALAAAAFELVRTLGLPWLQLYVPEHIPGAVAFARSVGLRPHSSMWELRLAEGAAVPQPAFPPGFETRGLRDGELPAFVALMNDTFADHPTPVSWTEATVRTVHSLPGFDPAGRLLVAPRGEPDRPVAFTTVETGPGDDGSIEGWIALIGVLPAWRGRGLGRELLRWGVARCRAAGAARIELSVEGLNERALGLYRREGFVPTIEWPHWIRETGIPYPAARGGGGTDASLRLP